MAAELGETGSTNVADVLLVTEATSRVSPEIVTLSPAVSCI